MIENNWKTGSFTSHVLSGHSGSVSSVSYVDNWLVSGSWVSILSNVTNKENKCFCFCLFITKDKTLALWDLETKQQVRVFSGHVSDVQTCVFDGEMIVSGSSDSTVKLWNFNQTSALKTFNGGCPFLLPRITNKRTSRFC